MSRLKEIMDGWIGIIFHTKEEEDLAIARIKVCVECEFLNAFNICSKCCCPHVAKAYSPTSRCPMNKWADGWGTVVVTDNTSDDDVEVILKIGDKYISSFEIENELKEKSDPLYIFASEEEFLLYVEKKVEYEKAKKIK